MDATDSGDATPAVSVCIPLYDKVDYIGRTLTSVLAQTFTDFEVVVLDNASTDGSAEVVRAFDDPRIRVVHHDATVPQVENFNRVVGHARARLVKIVMADDLIQPTALARQVEVLDRHPEVVVVSSRHDLVDDHDGVIARDRVLRTPDLVGRAHRAAIVRRVVRHGGSPLGVLGNMLFRRWAFDACGGFPDEPFAGDVALAVRLVTRGDFYGVPETLSSFRLAAGSVTSTRQRTNLRAQRAFIRSVVAEHHDVVRRRDVAAGTLRWPITWLRQRLFMAASGHAGSTRGRVLAAAIAPLDRIRRPRGATGT